MTISTITTNDTFGLLVTRTSQLITAYNLLEARGSLNTSVTAQTAFGVANSAFANGNTNFVVLQTVSGRANNAWLHANAAFANANTTHTLAIAAFSNANTTHTLTIASYAQANAAFTAANAASAAAAPGFNAANAAFLAANSSFANGNTNFAVTVAAFAKANAALPNATGTLAGTLTVTGDIIGKTASNTNTTVIRISTGTEFRAGTSRSTALAPADVFDAAAEVSVADGTTITFDLSSGFNFNVNLTARASRTVATPTNMKAGQSGYIRFKQGAATAQTAGYGSGWVFAGGTPPVFSTGTGNTDLLFFQVLSTANVFGSLSKDLRLNY
jgi:hypothetical protein